MLEAPRVRKKRDLIFTFDVPRRSWSNILLRQIYTFIIWLSLCFLIWISCRKRQWNSPDRRYHVSRYRASARTFNFVSAAENVALIPIHYSCCLSVFCILSSFFFLFFFCESVGIRGYTEHEPNLFEINGFIPSYCPVLFQLVVEIELTVHLSLIVGVKNETDMFRTN